MSLELSDVIHTRAEAFEALKLIAARHGRSLSLERVEGTADRSRQQQNVALCDALIDLLVAMFGVSGTSCGLRCGAAARLPVSGRSVCTSHIRLSAW